MGLEVSRKSSLTRPFLDQRSFFLWWGFGWKIYHWQWVVFESMSPRGCLFLVGIINCCFIFGRFCNMRMWYNHLGKLSFLMLSQINGLPTKTTKKGLSNWTELNWTVKGPIRKGQENNALLHVSERLLSIWAIKIVSPTEEHRTFCLR